MSIRPPEYAIILIGFRACGKTTLGRRLAADLRRPFFDLDLEIELAHGRSILRMFEQEGEAWFRQVEAEMLSGVLKLGRMVLAPGGGAVLLERNRSLLKTAGLVIYLRVPESDLLARLDRQGQRPRLTHRSLEDEVRELLKDRAPLYEQVAARIVDSTLAENEDQTYSKLFRVVQEGGGSPSDALP